MRRKYKTNVLLRIVTRSCLRSFSPIILWSCLSFLVILGLVSVILRDAFNEEPVNWTFRGIPLRDSPYGRQQPGFPIINNHNQFDIRANSDKTLGRKRTRNTAVVDDGGGSSVVVGGGGVNIVGSGGVIGKSLKIALKDTSKLKSHLSTKTIPTLPDLDVVKELADVIALPDLHPDFNPRIGCEEIASLHLIRRVGRGTTKDVYVSEYRNKRVAVKMVSPKVPDIKACVRRKMFRDQEECYMYANYKLMKEIALYQQLEHPNIAKLIGYCIQSEPLYNSDRDHGVISVVEFGSKASLHRISDMSWQQRLQATLALADLLDYLEHSPLGSLAIWDYKHSQFILTGDEHIKYSDLDDLSGDEPECETQEDCIIPKSNRIRVPCTHSRCHGYNAKFNLLRTTKEFLKPLLKDAPEEYQTELDELFEKLKVLQINAKDVRTLLTEMNNRPNKTGI